VILAPPGNRRQLEQAIADIAACPRPPAALWRMHVFDG
jgi:hypothetical protein